VDRSLFSDRDRGERRSRRLRGTVPDRAIHGTAADPAPPSLAQDTEAGPTAPAPAQVEYEMATTYGLCGAAMTSVPFSGAGWNECV
jgi:hypothetical protein